MSHLFISYAHEDEAVAAKLTNSLQAAGFSTWYFDRNHVAGVKHDTQTTEEISRCDAIVVVISPKSVSSHNITGELTTAELKGKPIMPLLYKIPHDEFRKQNPQWADKFGTTQCESVKEDMRETVQRVVAGLSRLKIVPAGRRTFGTRSLTFPGQANKVDEAADFVRGVLEADKLETQVRSEGLRRIVQGKASSRRVWMPNVVKASLGLSKAITVSLAPNADVLEVTIGTSSWIDKAIGGAIGAFVFWPFAFTTGWGVYKQRELFSHIEHSIEAFLKTRK